LCVQEADAFEVLQVAVRAGVKPSDKSKHYVFYCEVKEKIHDAVMAARPVFSEKAHFT